MPDGVKPPPLSGAAWGETLRSRALMTTVLVTVLYAAGQFVLFSYFAPYFKQNLDMGPTGLALMFMWFGIFGLIGNVVMSRYVDRIGADRCVLIGVTLMAVTLLLFPLGTSFLTMAIIIIPWGLGCFSSNSAQQARLVGVAPPLAAASVALNSSAMYAGQAIGAASGGWLIARGQMDMLHWYGLAALLVSMAASVAASRFVHRTR